MNQDPAIKIVYLIFVYNIKYVFFITVKEIKEELQQQVEYKNNYNLCNISAFKTELLSIGDAVIAVIGSAKSGEFISVCHPVEVT